MKLYNRDLPSAEHITFMGWVCEGYLNPTQTGQDWVVRFLALRGSELYIFDKPPVRKVIVCWSARVEALEVGSAVDMH